mmetsp:Transcript_20256/g.31661  ORF Transcript_20256/g.31661 Transcript_20256/m.31661 type:complete len:440 (-) Transcript_20256:2631-3950(-)
MARTTSSSATRGSNNNLSRLIKLLISLLFLALVAIQLSLGSQLSKLDPPRLHDAGRKPIQYDDTKQIIRHDGNAHAHAQSTNIDAKLDAKVVEDEERLITPNGSDSTLQGRERLWQMLTTRNVTQVYASYWNSVPQWDTVLTNIHRTNNPSPIIHGLETCEAFQRITADNPSQRRIAPAGIFNTGTNLLSVLLEYNCQNPHRVAKFHGNAKRGHGNEWQPRWGKHTPSRYRGAYVTSKKPKYSVDEVLPIVLVRNPYGWMKSMCRNPYTASWEGRSNSKTCPKLKKENNRWNDVHVKFGPGQTNHKSLGHLFNDWYGDYFYSNSTIDERNTTAPFPRLMIRFEDIIFFPKEVTEAVCKCAGGILGHRADDKDVANGTFHYVVRSAKAGFGHGPPSHRNGLIDSWIRYGSVNPQTEYSSDDLTLAQQVFDPLIMDAFAYR